MVKVKYGEPYKTSFGRKEDKFKVKTLEKVVEKIEEKYRGKPYVETIRDYALIIYNKNEFVSKIKKGDRYVHDLGMKLKKGDELLIMMLLGGG